MGTELRVFKQSDEGDAAVRRGYAILETFATKRIFGTDDTKGIVRKQLELVLGETKDDVRRVCYW